MDVAEFARLHDVLAKHFKEYEQQVGRLPPIEVLNELRYALRASIELLNLHGEPESSKGIELKARIHHALLCAYHDLVDGLVISIPRMLDELRLQFPKSSREVAGPRLIEIMTHVKSAEQEIAEARGRPELRHQTYENLYSKWFDELLGDYAFLREAQSEIAAHHEETHSEAADDWARSGRRSWLLYWITLPITLVVGWFASEVWEYLQNLGG